MNAGLVTWVFLHFGTATSEYFRGHYEVHLPSAEHYFAETASVVIWRFMNKTEPNVCEQQQTTCTCQNWTTCRDHCFSLRETLEVRSGSNQLCFLPFLQGSEEAPRPHLYLCPQQAAQWRRFIHKLYLIICQMSPVNKTFRVSISHVFSSGRAAPLRVCWTPDEVPDVFSVHFSSGSEHVCHRWKHHFHTVR